MGRKVSKSKAIIALISSPTIKGAAIACGVSEKTMHAWLNDNVFFQAYREAQARVMEATMSQTINATTQAIQTLVDIMTNESAGAGARVTAAKAILDVASKTYETETVIKRLDLLEDRLNGPVS